MRAFKVVSLLGAAWGFALAVSACTSGMASSEEHVDQVQGAVFANGDFETGTAGQPPPSWTVTPYLNNTGLTIQTPQTRAGLNLTANAGNALTTILSGTGQADPNLGSGASIRYCRYGSKCAVVNFHSSSTYGNSKNVNSLSQTMTVGAADIDPVDNQIHVRFVVAPVLQNPAHVAANQPYYFVQVTNLTTGNILYTDFNLSAQPGVPWKTINGGMTTEIDYVDWSLVDVAPGPSKLAQGDSVKLEIIAAGCQQAGHFGEVYVDGVGTTVPGLFVSGSTAQQVNPGSDLTYNMTYKNSSAADATGVTLHFTTPPNTTFQSISVPGGSCSIIPAVGGTGTATCALTNPLAVGASGTYTVVVNVNATATGQVTCGTYDVASDQETPLIGSKIQTTVGCSTDAICSTGFWCNESGNACVATLANGTSIPTDNPHTSPTLNGSCTATAGALVCTSAVCDPADDACGKLNNTAGCTLAAQCRSGICDTDGTCGYGTNHGPCSASTAAAVCRSGACSTNLLCRPSTGCNVDADCTSGNWCNETSHTCNPKLTNGSAIPNDTPHASPTLNGSCSTAAASLVCVANVCDTSDNKCGYDTNGGPCSASNAATVCRSGTCSANLLCRPSTGCNVDADCATGLWCLEGSHVCSAKLANGTTIPTDSPHSNPTLNGVCSDSAGSLVCLATVCDTTDDKCGKLNGHGACTAVNGSTVCRSGLCDTDSLCGYADNHGPCTAVNGATVCRSGSCSTNLLCQPSGGCNVDADCTAGKWCNETSHACTPKLTNGTAIPTDTPHASPALDGSCTAPAATLVCQAAVCDAIDNKCGYNTGEGPCTSSNAATVCRSGTCSANGTCRPPTGCNVDADCTGGNWCQETTHVCTAVLSNGTAIPSDPPHAAPTLAGTCSTAAATLVCESGVCDAADDKCGYDVGHGSCTTGTAASVCRSGACSNDGHCRPATGCNLDSDCSTGNWCQESNHSCNSPLANGAPVPTDATHTSPTLDGSCTAAASALVCQSAVCDPADNECGLAVGDGPCTMSNGATVCRSATCSSNGTCQPANGCNVDADCALGTWCNEASKACVPTLANGVAVPTDAKHTSPALDGNCRADAAALVCTSGVCDDHDDECGLGSGVGPCTAANGGTVCRSGLCSTTGSTKGTCVDCLKDADCSGDTPFCVALTNTCGACKSSTDCSGATPICNTDLATCVRCDGDNGSKAAHPCPTTGAPSCTVSGTGAGTCSKCTTDKDCTGHAGNVCQASTGLCISGCATDSDCSSSQWCDADGSGGMCQPKLENGQPLPSAPSRVATCSADVGKAVCESGVCDPADNMCGLAPGSSGCADAEQCRSGTCDPNMNSCTAQCSTDADCSSGDYCSSDSVCAPRLPIGSACLSRNQCQSNDCTNGMCSELVGSGSGLVCAARPLGAGSHGAWGSSVLGLMLAAGGLARRRRASAERRRERAPR